MRSCLQRIEETEPAVRAWVHLDPEHALRQARAADEHRRGGADPGPLHGLPVGVKDIFDTREWPTECGTPADGGPAAALGYARRLGCSRRRAR